MLKLIFMTMIVNLACGANHRSSVCLEPKKTGMCRAYFPRYFYNSKINQCETFVYGGCGANGNNFHTLQECEDRCGNDCSLPVLRGPCYASMQKFYYNPVHQLCARFNYGGCLGNKNRFDSNEACERKCVHPCLQQERSGPCFSYHPRYYFNKSTKRCEAFIWGGCRATENNFTSRKTCEETCKDMLCKNPGLDGSCNDAHDSYWVTAI